MSPHAHVPRYATLTVAYAEMRSAKLNDGHA